jgi:hypothetical protein
MKIWGNFASLICVTASLAAPHSVLASKAEKTEPPEKAVASVANDDATLHNVAQKGTPLAVVSNVSDEASIQAVLIPNGLARRIFGKEVAKNYAVIELIISNRDANAALVVHSIFLDTSKWLLSGPVSHCTSQLSDGMDKTQQVSNPCHVASIESRLVRGEMLDAQQWTARNWTIRGLTAVGAVGAGFAFPFSGDVAKGISSFNGVVVPGASTLWPDGTVNQINRISDFGFQTNKVIAKQSSDIVVAFFPIDRFLTKGFRQVFLSDPAAWFTPYELLADPKTKAIFSQFVGPLLKVPVETSKVSGEDFEQTLLRSMLAHCDSPDGPQSAAAPPAAEGVPPSPLTTNQAACQLQQFVNGVSLNNIRVAIEGVMTVDVGTVPATIYSVDFDKGNEATIWTTTGTDQAGTISGVYLTGGIPSVVDGSGKAIKGVSVKAVAAGSSDTKLRFTMTLSQCILAGTKVLFVVNKTQNAALTGPASDAAKPASTAAQKSGTPVPSTPYEFPVQPASECTSSGNGKGAEASPATGSTPAAAPPGATKAEQVIGDSGK